MVVITSGDCIEPILISAANPGPLTGRGTNTWLLDGAVPTLIDAGVGAPAHLDALRNALRDRSLARLLVTHGHADHASGVPAIQEIWPSVEIWAFQIEGHSGWRMVEDGSTIDAGDGRLRVIHTPGHAIDHVCFWDEHRRWLFAGDMLLAGSSVMIAAGHGGNLRQYLSSLQRLAQLNLARIYPGHGDVIDRPAELIAEYLNHRHARETQILACIAEGIRDVDMMVNRIYPNLAPDLRAAARLTVEAHLEKLREEGRLAW